MGRILITIIFLFAGTVHAQLGLTSYYHTQQKDYWQIIAPDGTSENLLNNMWGWGIDIKIKPFAETRIEFHPELEYAMMKPASTDSRLQAELEFFSFSLGTHIYPLNFTGDCNCPTFSKQNPFFKKGFFINISPGLSFLSQKVEFEQEVHGEGRFIYSLGLGAGLDFGISRRITITSFINGRLFSPIKWTYLNTFFDQSLGEGQKKEGNFIQINPGIRLEFQIKK